jgi:(p)ppGpp synthase/HD superfamily hydrolase
MVGFSPRLEIALEIAATAHKEQSRKGNGMPYIVHPVHVAIILLKYGFAEEVVIAGLLHDVVEDTEMGLATIREQLGERVATLVAHMTDAPYGEREHLTWEAQRAILLEHLRHGDPDVVAIKVADCLHNVATLNLELQSIGISIWERFSRGAVPTLEFHRKVLVVAEQVLGNHPMVTEFRDTIDQVAKLSGYRNALRGVKGDC